MTAAVVVAGAQEEEASADVVGTVVSLTGTAPLARRSYPYCICFYQQMDLLVTQRF